MYRKLNVVATGLLLLAARVNADVIYDNVSPSTGATSGGDAGVSSTLSHGPLADSFSTGSVPGTLVDLKLLMAADTPSDAGTATVSLLSDSSTQPGSVIAVLGTVMDSSLMTSPSESVIDLPISPATPLAANTRYWIEIGGTNTSANWSYDNTNVGVGVANEYNYYNGSVSANSSFTPYQMAVTVNSLPEPTTLGVSGVVAAALLRRRRAGSPQL